MAAGPIEFSRPTSSAFARMKGVLFQPFDLGKWFVLGFSAWLAGLLDGGGSSSGGGGGGDDPESAEEFEQFFEEAKKWVLENIELVIGIGVALFVIVAAIILVCLWLSSRGKFMFLDNVIHNRALVKVPWATFKALGNSLFRWRIGFTIISLLVVLLLGGGIGGYVYYVFTAGEWATAPIVIVIGMGLLFLLAMLVLGYIGMLLEDFVIPLMYRGSLSTNEAWREFLVLHKDSVGSFLVYFLWRTLLGLAAAIAIILVGFGTCCIGFLIMAIPYVGAVLLLPVSVFFRFLGPEFLRQFGEPFDVLSPTESVGVLPSS